MAIIGYVPHQGTAEMDLILVGARAPRERERERERNAFAAYRSSEFVCSRVRLRRVRKLSTCERLHLHRSAKGAHVVVPRASASAFAVRTRWQLTSHASLCVRVSLRRVYWQERESP